MLVIALELVGCTESLSPLYWARGSRSLCKLEWVVYLSENPFSPIRLCLVSVQPFIMTPPIVRHAICRLYVCRKKDLSVTVATVQVPFIIDMPLSLLTQ